MIATACPVDWTGTMTFAVDGGGFSAIGKTVEVWQAPHEEMHPAVFLVATDLVSDFGGAPVNANDNRRTPAAVLL